LLPIALPSRPTRILLLVAVASVEQNVDTLKMPCPTINNFATATASCPAAIKQIVKIAIRRADNKCLIENILLKIKTIVE